MNAKAEGAMEELVAAGPPRAKRGGPASWLRRVGALAAKDIRAELRAKEVLGTMVAYSVAAAVIFGLAFDLRVPRPELIAPGILWVSLLFTGLLGLQRAFGSEVDRGTLTGLLLAPVDRSALFFGKIAASLFYFLVVEAFLLPALLILFDVNLLRPTVLLGLALGTLGYATAGVMFSALTARTRAREALLPVLLLPVLVPLFIAGVSLTIAVVDGRPAADARPWLALLALFDLLVAAASLLLFDLIWEQE